MFAGFEEQAQVDRGFGLVGWDQVEADPVAVYGVQRLDPDQLDFAFGGGDGGGDFGVPAYLGKGPPEKSTTKRLLYSVRRLPTAPPSPVKVSTTWASSCGPGEAVPQKRS